MKCKKNKLFIFNLLGLYFNLKIILLQKGNETILFLLKDDNKTDSIR